jgi:hypothetical protein
VGIVAGAILAISAILWMRYYPIWSLTYTAVGILVVYAWRPTARGLQLEALSGRR